MSSYFVNSLSACYGQTMGLEGCGDGGFHRNGGYQHTGGLYHSFARAGYPYASKEERLDDPTDYYGGPRLSHLPPNSPCGSPHNLHAGSQNIQNVHPLSDRSACIRTSSNGSSSYYPNGHVGSVGDRNRSPPSQQPPPTPPQSQPQPQGGGTGSGPTSPHSPRPSDQGYQQPQIYPWMRRMQYAQGKRKIFGSF